MGDEDRDWLRDLIYRYYPDTQSGSAYMFMRATALANEIVDEGYTRRATRED